MAALTPIAGPVFVPQPAVGTIRYGLLTAANGPFPMPDHGDVGGVQYLEEHCGQAHLLAAASCSNPTVTAGSTLDACDGTAIGLPFQVVAGLKAGAFPYDATEVERRVRIRLADNSQYVAEQAFWGGNADVQSVLARAELNGGSGISDVTPTPEFRARLLRPQADRRHGSPGQRHRLPGGDWRGHGVARRPGVRLTAGADVRAVGQRLAGHRSAGVRDHRRLRRVLRARQLDRHDRLDWCGHPRIVVLTMGYNVVTYELRSRECLQS